MEQAPFDVFAGSARWIAAGVFVLLLGLICLSDLRTRRIPNRIVLVLLAVGLALSVVADPVLPGAVRALQGIGIGFAVWLPLCLLGMVGAGDVKLFAAASAWLGPSAALQAALLSALAGGALAIAWVVGTGACRQFVVRFSHVLWGILPEQPAESPGQLASGSRRIPYGIAMAIGLVASARFPHLLY